MKKNTSWFITFTKVIELLKDAKWICIVLIIFMLTFRVSCNNNTGQTKWDIGCYPVRIADVKEIIK